MPKLEKHKKENEYSIDKCRISNYSNRLIGNLCYIDSQILKLRNSTYNPSSFPSFEQLLHAPSVLHLAGKYGPMSGWPLTIQEFGEKQQQLNITCCTEDSVSISNLSVNTKHWLKFDIMLSIEFLKTLDFFQYLKHSDQIVLAKKSTIIIESMIFAYTSFQNKSACFKSPDGFYIDIQNMIDIIDVFTEGNIRKNENVLRDHLKSSQNVMGYLIQENVTKKEFILLQTIAICDPIVDLSEEGREIIRKNRQKYSRILLDLCLLEYGKRNGPSRFVTLISFINLIIFYRDTFRNFMLFSKINTPSKFSKTIGPLENAVLELY
ncbi:unnamed protein product [Caenorhabditis angaria]|uniref:NR LBD domain-containing protein n=1 Tax=Caenorhabditis angaria TaxID=860376 RepID=A0A9P1IZK9_9PELO|nr:unnamed protein product [Caenorhabditis angaria]